MRTVHERERAAAVEERDALYHIGFVVVAVVGCGLALGHDEILGSSRELSPDFWGPLQRPVMLAGPGERFTRSWLGCQEAPMPRDAGDARFSDWPCLARAKRPNTVLLYQAFCAHGGDELPPEATDAAARYP